MLYRARWATAALCFWASASAWAEAPPTGWLDAVTPEGQVMGWTSDPDAAGQAIQVHLYFDGYAGSCGAGCAVIPGAADRPRPDVNRALGVPGDHGFSIAVPDQFRDGLEHEVWAYGIDATGPNNAMLQGSPKRFRLEPAARAGPRPAVADFWPMPSGDRSVLWWAYRWNYGEHSYPAGDAARCPDRRPRMMGVSARRYGDGAFGREPLVAINFFKDHRCLYWDPGREAILRWYAIGMQESQMPVRDLVTGSDRYSFLAFRGDARWLPDRTASTKFYGPGKKLRYSVNGRYEFMVNGQHSFAGGYRYGFQRGLYPSYGALPDRPLDADIVVSGDPANAPLATTFIKDEPLYQPFGVGESGWNRLRANTTPGTPKGNRWALYPRRSSFTFRGRPVQYVGYSETSAAESVGACEEWWFAEGVGPVFIASYVMQDWQGCRALLAATSSKDGVDRPLEHFRARRRNLHGWHELVDLCLESDCDVER